MFILILSSCEKKQVKIDYNNQNHKDSLTMESIVNDTSKILVAGLPIYFDSTDCLIHPIELVSLKEIESKGFFKIGSYSDRKSSNNGVSIVNSRDDEFSGDFTNLIFENLNTRNQKLLTPKVININHVQYLKELSKIIKRKYLLYSVIDKDLNRDGFLNSLDIESLYISSIDGNDFTKITDEYHEYNGGELILKDLKYFFSTTEDTNKDGSFDKYDKFHYYFIDFAK